MNPAFACDRLGAEYLNLSRRAKRLLRRKQRRNIRRKLFVGNCDNYDQVTDIDHLYTAMRKCAKGVRWKCSVQAYLYDGLLNIHDLQRLLQNEEDIRKGFVSFSIYERGKLRQIYSVHISERIPQRAFCDYVITPIVERSIISDNCASIKGKGELYAENALTNDLRQFYHQFGNNHGYILFFDLHNYFGSLDRSALKVQFSQLVMDERLRSLFNRFVDAFDSINEFKERGMGLGSQISQICGILALNPIDHFIKEVLPNGAGRWMCRYQDDSYIIGNDYDDLVMIRSIIFALYESHGYQMNEKKCVIVPIWKSFVWLKKRYQLTATGRVVRKVSATSVSRMRITMKRGYHWVCNGSMTFFDYENTFRSWIIATNKYYDSYASVLALRSLFHYECFRLLEDDCPYMTKLKQIIQQNMRMDCLTVARIGTDYMLFDMDARQLSGISTLKVRTLHCGHAVVSFSERKLPKYISLLSSNMMSYRVYRADMHDTPKLRQHQYFDPLY